MKIKLLIASDDIDYIEHLSKTLTNSHSDMISLSICTSLTKLDDMLKEQKYEAALFEAHFCEKLDTTGILLPMVLWTDDIADVLNQSVVRIQKYQRISTMYTEILENYSKVSTGTQGTNRKKANITAVWSPTGGVGKTAVALALATLEVSREKQVMYLNLESFSSTPAYFDTSGKSISTLFEMLETREGNLEVLTQSLLMKDSVSSVTYFCPPESLDDMNILSTQNISALLQVCSGLTEELIIDMASLCDERVRYIFELADRILLISDQASTAKTKLEQFMNRHSVFSQIKDKLYLVANRGSALTMLPVRDVVTLPQINSSDEMRVIKTLAASLETGGI